MRVLTHSKKKPQRFLLKATKRPINRRLFENASSEKVDQMMDDSLTAAKKFLDKRKAPPKRKYQTSEGLPRPKLGHVEETRTGVPLDWSTDEEDDVDRGVESQTGSSDCYLGYGFPPPCFLPPVPIHYFLFPNYCFHQLYVRPVPTHSVADIQRLMMRAIFPPPPLDIGPSVSPLNLTKSKQQETCGEVPGDHQRKDEVFYFGRK